MNVGRMLGIQMIEQFEGIRLPGEMICFKGYSDQLIYAKIDEQSGMLDDIDLISLQTAVSMIALRENQATFEEVHQSARTNAGVWSEIGGW